jgi:ribosome-associated protein
MKNEIDHSEKIEMIVSWLTEKKASQIVSLDVKDKCSFTEHMIVCSGLATLHNKAIANHLLDKAYENKFQVLGKEGFDAATWILIDLNDVIVHIFTDEVRKNYRLEDLWLMFESTTRNL